MLNSDSLPGRIAEWSARFQADFRPYFEEPSRLTPILWYQAAHQFTHDLKNSASLSADAGFRNQFGDIERCNLFLLQLAENKKELEDGDKSALAGLLSSPFTIAALKELLEGMEARAKAFHQNENFDLISRAMPWDGFSRARAQSAIRYHYQFLERVDALSLLQLEAHDHQVNALLRGMGGLMVVRQLEPAPGSAGSGSEEMQLECYQLGAIPKDRPMPPPGWKGI